jgi:zinc/manganese transport system substrate-binding protein
VLRVTRQRPTGAALLGAIILCLAGGGCGRTGPAAPATPPGGHGAHFEVVAGENFWGSIAAQLAGDRASVTSIIVNPDTDPHSYEPTARDARTFADANMAIVNGVGYDNWATRLLDASPSSARVILNVGDLLGLHEGDNPHRWYYPANISAVANLITRDYDRLDPADAGYFEARRSAFEDEGLARYRQLIAEIRERYAGVPVGYSESIFQGLGEALGLKLLTPYSFARAIAEGSEVTADDKETVDRQAQTHQIRVWIFNSQNVTPDVQRVNELAREQHIPIATVTETLSPASESFQQWQVSELEGLMRALHQATGR